jgi:autotransporter-associated beta strand protein
MGASNVLSNSTDVTVAAPATFDLNGTSQTIGSLAGAGSVVLGAGALTAGGDDASTTYSGNMSGVGGVFLKAGNGVATFSGSNSYTGATFINHGTLRLGADDVLSDSTAVHIAPVATFDVNGHSDTIGALSGAGSVTLGSGSLTSGADNSSAGYPGIMSGAGGSYTKAGLGVATFNNVHTYDGLTHITGGTLFLAGTGSIVSSVKVEAGSTFDVSDFGATGFTVAPGKTLSGGGTVAGKTIITNTATVSPGSSPGALSLGDQEWGQGGTYVWEVNDATGTAGTGFDQLQLSGALAVTSTSGNTFTIDVRSLTAGNTPGDAQNFDKTQNYSWIIASTSAPVSIDPAVVTILTTGFTNDITATGDPGAQNGAFTISADGDNVLLNYSAAPEPASTALLALTLTATLTRRPRRRVAIGA